MYYLDSEKSIIKDFQMVDEKDVYFTTENEEIIEVFKSIYDQQNWKEWTESAGKSDPPPDFFQIHINT